MHLFTQEPFGDLDDQDLLEGTHNTDRGICEGRRVSWLGLREVDTVHVNAELCP